MQCDFCRRSDEMVQICAFGELGATVHLHPWCQDELADAPRERQDAVLKKATHRRDFAFPHKTG